MNERLAIAKQRWAEKQKAAGRRALAEPATGRLPPGQRLVRPHEFPVLDLGVHPDVPTASWQLRIDGAVGHPATLDWAALLELPQADTTSDFHCVTTWSKYDCRWGGVAFSTLCDLVEPSASARHVFFTAYDGYTVNTPLERLLEDPDVLLATSFQGAPIPREHGGPARIIIPRLYAWKGAKWVRHIHFMDHDRLGYWEQRGYSNTADPWTEDRYA